MLKVGDYYNLKENENTIISKREENGYEEQKFHKEEIKWKVLHIDEARNKMLLIADKPTEQEITLQRKRRIY